MTPTSGGFALAPGASLEDLDMGGGSVLRVRLSGHETSGRLAVVEGTVLEGGPPLHVHESEDEVVVVLEGRVDYQIGAERGALDAGGLLWFPRQVPHTIANLSGRPCRLLTVATPSGVEDLFRAQRDYLHALPAGGEPDPTALAQLPGAETRRVVGPPLT